MPVHNEEVARIFEEIADLLALRDENPFRIRAYLRAAQSIRAQRRELADRVREGEDIDALPGIGPDLKSKIIEILNTGRCQTLDRLRKKVPAGLRELLRIHGLGPKRVRALWNELKIGSRADLQRAIADGTVPAVRGFGPKLVARLAEELKSRSAEERRWLRPIAAQFAEPLAAYLRAVPGIEQVLIAGSYRRGRETVGDIDLLVGAADETAVKKALLAYDEIGQWLAQGDKNISVILRSGLRIDIRISAPSCFGAGAHYFTGSKAHNIHVRRLGQEHGLKINEYGVFRRGRIVAGDTEASVFACVGLPYIPVELREDQGEVEAARGGRLPLLLSREDLRGDLHSHTKSSDGHDSLKAMALAARTAGLEYLAITDHSRHLGIVHGLDEAELRKQMESIDRLNEQFRDITLLKGVEVDILESGELALPDRLLAELDVVVAAIHGHFDLPADRQTDRILRAMEHRAFSILAHPGSRLIGQRPSIAFDLERVCRAAKSRPCFLELNAQPDRLDLDDAQCRMVRDHGVLISISSDAHDASQLDNLQFGVTQARRGWLSAADVLNAHPLAQVHQLLKSTIL